MKTFLLIWIFLLASFNAFSQNDSIIYHKIDSLNNVYKSSIQKQDSLILTITEIQKTYQIKESLFSNQLEILTAIFSAIVAISIFVIGYLLPKLINEKQKNELNNLFKEFETIRDEIEKRRKETEKLELKNSCNNSRIMFFSCVDAKNKLGELLWALRFSKDYFNFYTNPEDDEVVFYIDRALNIANELKNETYLKQHVDEVNSLTTELAALYEIEGLKDKLSQIKEKFNIVAWKEPKQK
ncbi:MAG: hypothetical protein AB9833_03945 [Bacteroidales bacterium]